MDHENRKKSPENGKNCTFSACQGKIQDQLTKLWNGEVGLSQMFWLYYFLAIFVLKFIGGPSGILSVLCGILSLAWAGFMVRPIIRAADRYEGEKHWKELAKISTAVIPLAILLDMLV